MKNPHKKANVKIAAVIIALLVFAGIGLLDFAGVFKYLENKTYDLRIRLLAGFDRPSDDIIVILIKQDSLDWAQKERGWSWPWPRKAYGELLDYMKLGNANSVAFDIIFSEPSIYNTVSANETADTFAISGIKTPLISAEDDEAFARAEKDFGRAVQVVMVSSQSGSAVSWPPDLPVFEPTGFGGFLEQFGRGGGGSRLSRALFPVRGIMDGAAALGCATGFPDSDDVFRRLRLFTLFDGKAVPGLSAASLIVSGHDKNISFNSKNSSVQWGDFTVPVDKNGTSLLRFHGDLDRYIPYSAKDILQSYEAHSRGEEPLLPPEDFEGKYVFVGLYTEGLFDIFNTPISSLYPGMGVHVTMLDNLLNGNFIRESHVLLNLLILFAIAALTIALCLFQRRLIVQAAAVVFEVLAVIAAAFAAYHWGSLWIPLVMYLAGIAAAFITGTLYNYVTEGSQKRFIKSAFSQYLSPKVIEQIIADPGQLKLGGEKREMTAIFTDVRSFSTITEALGDPEKLVELLNYYLTRMSNIILENQGTIDKYEGDAIIAFFGAPVHMDNHASLACRSAVLMKKAEADVNREALEKGLITNAVLEAMVKKGILQSVGAPCPMFTRLGLNTGDMVVGNMGTPSKMDYTIMGNAVNLAARLEGVNKQYNTGGILISEYTRAQIGDEFILRPLSFVRVVGINTPLRLYELLDIRDNAPPGLLDMVKRWEQGFALYEQKDFLAAGNIFQAIFQQNNADLAAKKYYDRCNKYTLAPPDEKEWDGGVDNLTEK
ncbi:MAG: adenylate/guanylate cyclase domain-containing protein [Treponema sp.]|jgi:adenylate cyclase|nr:adenylate/guanylate cyclase domain-containing protein [Treponema sp.]